MANAFVGNMNTMTSERSRTLRRERLQDDADRQERLDAPVRQAIKDAADMTAKTAGKLVAAELTSELQNETYRLTHEPSPDFVAPQYDGRFKSAEEITDAITASWKHFQARTDDKDCSLVYQFLQQNFNTADTTRPETFELAYKFILAKLRAIEAKYAAPEPEVIASEPQDQFNDAIIRSLEEELTQCPTGDSRRRESIEHRLQKERVTRELVCDDFYRPILQGISDDSGLKVTGDTALKFRGWIAQPQQRHRYDSTELDVRLAWAEFCDCTEHLNSDELRERDRRRAVNQMTSLDVEKEVGRTRSYGFDSGRRV